MLRGGPLGGGLLGGVLGGGLSVGGPPLPEGGVLLGAFLSAGALGSPLKPGALGGRILRESGGEYGRQVHVRELPHHPQREQTGDGQGREQYLERVVFPADSGSPP